MSTFMLRVERITGLLLFWAVVLFFLAFTLIPVIWGALGSAKVGDEMFASPFSVLPHSVTFVNYLTILTDKEFIESIVNTIVVAGIVTGLALVFGGAGAYALGRYEFRGRKVLRYLILMMNVFPAIAILPALAALVRDLGLNGSLLSLVIVYPLTILPIMIWSTIAFFRALPPDIEEAAAMDGATVWQLFFWVIIPISAPVLLTNGLLVFVTMWSEYLLALTFTSVDPTARTLTVAIKYLKDRYTPGQMMAAAMVASLPLVLLIFFLQRNFIRNTTEGGVKG